MSNIPIVIINEIKEYILGIPFDTYLIGYYSLNELFRTKGYKNSKGYLVGTYEVWWPNGNKFLVENFKDGIKRQPHKSGMLCRDIGIEHMNGRHGNCKRWNDEGILFENEEYKDGFLINKKLK